VTFDWVDLALTLAIVVAGCAVSYFLLLRKLQQSVSKNQREMERRLSALTEAITLLEARLAEPDSSADALAEPEIESGVVEDLVAKPVEMEKERIAPEIQVAIAAAAFAVLGRNARVRSAREITRHDVVSPWSQQGRVTVQSSHNLRSRG
jgi:hypothetical protein